MYEEEKNERSYFFRNLTVKVLLILLFIFLLMWLFPMPNLSPFYDKIFTQNINGMTDAAKSYFTTSRLPSKEGDSKTITLKEMLDNKMLIEFTDSDGKTCDVNKSYVEVTKKDGEYIFKTNLSCSSQEDYVVEYFGCYDVCENCSTTEEKTEKVIEYQFYKVNTEKLVDKYFCKDGYTLSGTKCVLKTSIQTSEESQIKCFAGYTYNKDINKCEKKEIEKTDAVIKCEKGYIYATSIKKCVNVETGTIDAEVEYKCPEGRLNNTTKKCVIEKEPTVNYTCTEGILNNTTNKCIIERDPVIGYVCTEGTLDNTTKKCIIETNPTEGYACTEGTLNTTTNKCVSEKDSNLTYSCSRGTVSGSQCKITTTSTTPVSCSYKWTCSKKEYKSKQDTVSTSSKTVKLVGYGSNGTYIYETCVKVQTGCSGGDTTSSTSYEPATPNYSCTEGTLNNTTKKCIVEKNAVLARVCTVGTLNNTTNKCVMEKDATLNYICIEGTLNNTTKKCVIERDATPNYTCTEGTLNDTTKKCVVKKAAEIKYICNEGIISGSKCIVNTTITKDNTYECLYGSLTDKNKCLIVISDKEDPTYSCKKGYSLIGSRCYKLSTCEDVKDAEVTYKTISTKVYKWSRSKTLKGWTATGKTRTVTVKVTSK